MQAATILKKKLIVFGNGPVHDKLVGMAGYSIEFRTDRFGDASDLEYEKIITRARGFIYPAEEDFGIVTVEALAAGAPVIGLGKAGTLDIIKDGETGVLFSSQDVESVIDAITKAESIRFSQNKIRESAKKFDKKIFLNKIREIVKDNCK